MSLKVWLPLNGNVNQQGLSGITMFGGPASWGTNGKIGKCATFSGNAANVIFNNTTEFNYTDNFSWTIWVNTNYTGTTGQYVFTVGRADAGGYGYGLQNSSTTQCIVRFGTSTWNIDVAGGKWTHLVFTKNGTNINIYKDGSLYSTATFSGILPTYSDGNGLGLGCFHYSGNIYPFYGSINDFRIYDHVLSPKEVKEISKGLILHYKLDTQRLFSNLKKNNTYGVYNNFSGSGTTASLTKLNETYQGCDVYRLTMTPNDSSLSSFKTTLHSHGVCGFSTTFVASTKYCFWIYYRPVTHSDIRVGGVASNIGGWTEIPPEKYSNEWYIVGQYRNGSVTEAKTDQIFVSFYTPTAVSGTPISIDFCCPHLIQGTTEIIDDGDYQETFNRNIERDCSGYMHNGNITGTLTNTANPPRYDTCTHISATNQKINVTGLTTTGFANSYTFAWWAKCATWSNMMHWGFSDGIRLNGIYNGNLWNTGDGSNNPLYIPGTTTQITASDTNWHHWVMTGNGTKCHVYKDGVLWAEAKTYKSISGTSIYINGWDSSTSYSNTNLDICDFRIYATALSAEDVKELYQTSASIDNKGNIYAYELEEV